MTAFNDFALRAPHYLEEVRSMFDQLALHSDTSIEAEPNRVPIPTKTGSLL
jgi:hypothetical protein